MNTKIPIVIDHDAGTNPDDVLAILLLLNAQVVDIKLLISGNGQPVERAIYAQHLLALAGREDIPSFAGEKKGHIAFYGDVSLHSTYVPPTDYTKALAELCSREKTVSYLAIQGLSNLNTFLQQYPQHASKLVVYHMGLTLTGADQGYVTGGTNIEADPAAAREVYQRSDLHIKIIGGHTTIHDSLRITPDTNLHQVLKQSHHPAHKWVYEALLEFHQRRGIWPALHDPLTASAALGLPFITFEDCYINFKQDGLYTLGNQTKVTISANADYQGFMDYFVNLLK